MTNLSASAVLESLTNVWDAVNDAYKNPFTNSGNRFFGEHCTIIAYEWADEPDYDFNFRWRDFQATWYKHLRRGYSCNRDLTLNEFNEMLAECAADIIKNSDAGVSCSEPL